MPSHFGTMKGKMSAKVEPMKKGKKVTIKEEKMEEMPPMKKPTAPKRKGKGKMPTREELEKMTAAQLRDHIKAMGETVKGASKMKKASLIDAIEEIHSRM
jgi:hypothetical protein